MTQDVRTFVASPGEKWVYIGRRLHTDAHWGNPFSASTTTVPTVKVRSEREAVKAFRDWMLGLKYQGVEPKRREWLLKNLWRLRNRTLVCYCKPGECHGEVYLELLNGTPYQMTLPGMEE